MAAHPGQAVLLDIVIDRKLLIENLYIAESGKADAQVYDEDHQYHGHIKGKHFVPDVQGPPGPAKAEWIFHGSLTRGSSFGQALPDRGRH